MAERHGQTITRARAVGTLVGQQPLDEIGRRPTGTDTTDLATDYEVLAARIPQSLRSCLAGVGDAERNDRNWWTGALDLRASRSSATWDL